jgi:regulator of cell morphogenesis and NO signaling
MKENKIKTRTVGQIVAEDHRYASVFRDAGIDFCCGGKKTLSESCIEKGIDEQELIGKLANVSSTPVEGNMKFNEWDPGFLSDYIINVHHSFVRKSIPALSEYTQKIALVHGDHHPELREVADLFLGLAKELSAHLEKEEEVLFPAIKQVFTGSSKAAGIVRDELNGYTEEHEAAGAAMDRINEITNAYALPSDACNSYRVAFDLLQKFEDDLHNHVHLENNILFPKTLNAITGLI